MKKYILYLVALLLIFACYKDNGEPLRTTYGEPIIEVFDSLAPPCKANLMKNTYTRITNRDNLINVKGYLGGKYIRGYYFYGNTYSNHFFKIEFKTKPLVRKNYITTKINNNSDTECVAYVTNTITNEELFADNLKNVYVDFNSAGLLMVSFCDINFKNSLGTDSMYVDDLNITIPN